MLKATEIPTIYLNLNAAKRELELAEELRSVGEAGRGLFRQRLQSPTHRRSEVVCNEEGITHGM